MFVKVCGLKTIAQIDKAIKYGFDAIGIVTHPKSKRFIPPKEAARLAAHAQGKIATVVVGLGYGDVEEVADAFDYIQIYEAWPVANLVLASKDRPPQGLACSSSISPSIKNMNRCCSCLSALV